MTSFRIDGGSLFITMAPQKGTADKSFDWSLRNFATLNEFEAGEVIAVIEGRTNGVGTAKDNGDGKGLQYSGFYHASKNGTAVIKFTRLDTGQLGVALSTDRDGNKKSYYSSLTVGEENVLRELLRRFIQDALANNDEEYNSTDGKDAASQSESDPDPTPPPSNTGPKSSGKSASGGKGTKAPKINPGPTAALGDNDEIPF